MSISTLKQDLADFEAKHADAVALKHRLANEIRLANAKADTGDRAALLSQPRLNREHAASSRDATALEGHVADARRRVELAENQAREIARIAAASQLANVPADKVFEVRAPDGRVVRHRAADADALQASLRDGYVVAAQIYGAAADGTGGFSVANGVSRETLLEALQ